MHPAIARHRSAIASICQRYQIQRLEVFGSATREDDFSPEDSDADFLVEFAPGVRPDLHRFYGAKAELEQLLGRAVDLVEPAAVRNPYVWASINRQRQSVYAASPPGLPVGCPRGCAGHTGIHRIPRRSRPHRQRHGAGCGRAKV